MLVENTSQIAIKDLCQADEKTTLFLLMSIKSYDILKIHIKI